MGIPAASRKTRSAAVGLCGATAFAFDHTDVCFRSQTRSPLQSLTRRGRTVSFLQFQSTFRTLSKAGLVQEVDL